MSKAVAIYEKKVSPLAQEADALVIKSPEDMTRATELLSKLNKTMDGVEEEEDKIVGPLKATIKVEQGRWKPFKDALKPAIDSLRKRMGAYQLAEDEKAAAKKAKIAERVGSGKGKLKLETAIEQADAVEGPESKIATENGSVGFRKDRKCEIIDATLVPREYCLPDLVSIRAAMKNGIEGLPGVRYFDEMVPINKR